MSNTKCAVSCTGSGSASGSRSVYSQSASGSDSRTISASSYSSARSGSSRTTDSRPVSAKLPVIASARPKAQTVVQPVVKPSTVKRPVPAVKRGKQLPDTASSSGSDSGSDSSYTSSGSDSSYSR